MYSHVSCRLIVACSLAVVMFAGGTLPAHAGELPGLNAAERRTLAIAPGQSLELEKVAEGSIYEATPELPAHFNITELHMGSIARGRWLFAVTFAAPYTFDNTSLLLYVDADNNPQTGRPGMGNEVVYGVSNGTPTIGLHVEEEQAGDFRMPRVALVDGVVFLSVDMPLNQEEGRSRFRISILSEQSNPHEGRDRLPWSDIDGPGESDLEPFKTLAEIETTSGFLVTQSMPYLWQMQDDERNIILNSYNDCEYEGFTYFHSEYRWPALRRTASEGTIKGIVPRAGRYYPGVVVYDGAGVENYEMLVGDEVIGVFSAREENRRQRLFFAEQPRQFRAGETITLRGASLNGSCIVEDIVLLAERPPVLEPPRAIENLEVAWDWHFGAMRATWTTTWPVKCTVVYDNRRIEGDQALQNHRMYLDRLREGRRHTLHIEAEMPDGNVLRSEAVTFTATPPPLPRGTVARAGISLSLLPSETSPPGGYPLTTGIPFERGVLGDTANLRLVDADGRELPMQARALVRWPDHSVKAALIDTVVPENNGGEVILEYGHQVSRSTVPQGITVEETGNLITVTTPTMRMEFDTRASGLFTRLWHDPAGRFGPETLLTRDDRPVRVVLTDDAGQVYDTLGSPSNVTVEEAGPLRTVVLLQGHHTGTAGRMFTYHVRMTFYARTPAVGLSYRWGNDYSADEFALLQGIRMELPLAVNTDAAVLFGSDEPVSAQAAQNPRLEQLYDDSHTVGADAGKRAPGWMLLGESGRQVGIVPRHFWQLYPKAIGVENGVPYYDIAPKLADDQYGDATDFDIIKLYFYLQNGRYKFRQGMTKVHDTLLVLPQNGAALDASAMQRAAELVNYPPILAASPEYYAEGSVFGRFVPRTDGRTPRYDEVTDRVRNGYLAHRENNRAYGMLNFGDQFGERGLNWFNGEYDHHFGAAQMFVRGNDTQWFHLMQEIARHDIDVDHVHYHTSPHLKGVKWYHAMGHTGRYFTHQYDPNQKAWVTERPEFPHLVGYGLPAGGASPCHSWTEGTCQYYMLTGDPTAIATARMLNDRYASFYLNNYDFYNGRDPGWYLIFTMATYRTTYDPYYLNAARIVVERVLERRTPGYGWERQMVPGHCYCEPRCRGAAGFMQGVLGAGLREYYEEIGDPRVPEAVVDSARYVIEKMWKDEAEGWSYTACPEMKPGQGTAPVMTPLLLFAWESSGDPKFLDIAVRGMNLSFEHLGSMAYIRWTPYIVKMLDRVEHEMPGIVGGPQGTTVVVKNEQTFPLELRLFTRDGRPAPAEAATLTGPELEPIQPDADGRIRISGPKNGSYILHIAPNTGPWQVTSNANRMVIGLEDGLETEIGELPGRFAIAPEKAGAPLKITVEALSGRVGAELFAPDGQRLAHGSGRGVTLAATAVSQAPHEVVITGPARVRVSAEGAIPWTAFSPRRHFNASQPSVQVQGRQILLPGDARVVNLQALVSDPEDDVETVRWKLPDGTVVEGEKLQWTPGEGTEFVLRVSAVDARGYEGSAEVMVTMPPVELDGENIVSVRAAEFSGQGGGEVMVTNRLGATGPIITMWHANLDHWLEWTFDVPKTGRYLLFARYATDSEPTHRSLSVDGASPGSEYKRIEFPGTGGFSTVDDNWRFKQLGPAITLEKGSRTVRMTNLGGGMAVDYLTIAPAKD